MHKVLIIGAGGVGSVAVHKCAEQPDVFSEITLASRTCEKCIEIAESIRKKTGRKIRIEKVDADSVDELIGLISKTNPSIVINTALPYQDLTIMEACLKTGVSYLDTANYEPPEEAKFEYSWQWAYHEQFTEKGLTAILGCGFDPGVTNIFCAYARDKLFDTIEYIDIIDCNAGVHGHPFATNFNPEINIREVTQRGKYWEDGEWKYTEPLSESMIIDFPEVGEKKAYLLYHEEEESLVKNIPGLKRIRFWMTFSDEYLTHLRVLKNVGMTGIEPVEFEGHRIIPLKFLKVLLPDPSSLSEGYTGKTSIGCIIEGLKDGRRIKKMIYNVCEHEKAHEEVGAQAVSYTTGVPAALGAEMFISGIWNKPGVWNVEQFDPVPFLDKLGERGLPWKITDL
jgi:saccharopine dehydrogenase (NAD+, L-lysine-forming)